MSDVMKREDDRAFWYCYKMFLFYFNFVELSELYIQI